MRKRRTDTWVSGANTGNESFQLSSQILGPKNKGIRCIRYCAFCFAVVFLTITVILWMLPSPIDPQPFQYSIETPSFSGSLIVNDRLKKAQKLFEDEIVGPEALAHSHEGIVYTGLGDGRIIRLSPDLSSFTVVARTGQPPYDNCGTEAAEDMCGRPLGMEFDHIYTDLLYVADSSHGLLQLNIGTGKTKVLLPAGTEVNGYEIKFLNDLTILDNKTILISESSCKYSRAENRYEVLEGSNNGRLLYYNLLDGSHGVLVDKLHFSNGICLSHDKHSLLIAETTRARILKYYLSGDKAGETEMFMENLPGLPDNISPSSSGGYWIGFAVIRSIPLEFMADTGVIIRKILSKWLFLVKVIEMILPKHSLVLEVDAAGNIVQSLHDQGGDVTAATSHILDLGDGLLIGSYFAPFLLYLKL